MMRRWQPITSPLVLILFLVATATAFAQAAFGQPESPVDRTSELKLVRSEFGLADGPAWDGRNALYVPDVKGQKLFRYVPSKDEWKTVLEGDIRLSASFFSHGKLFVSNNGAAKIESYNVSRWNEPALVVAECDPVVPPKRRPNDLVVDHDGGVYYTLTGQNEVVYVSDSGESRTVTTEVESPNGITLSPDHRTLYVAAYRPRKIVAVDLSAAGVASGVRPFAAMDDGEELGADGMSIDRAGNVYCAGATDVWIWNPDGVLLDRIACPTRPINCSFGDADLRTLYITGFGGLYSQRMRISGRPPEPPQSNDSQVSNSDSVPSTIIPGEIKAYLDTEYAVYGNRKVLADIFVPSGDGPFPAVLVVHGGGWLNGDKAKFRALAIELARNNFVTAAIEYRLGDETHFPAGIHDCNAAVRFLRASASRFRIDQTRIGAVGGSAGGHLVGLMAAGGDEPALQGHGGNSTQSSRLQAAIVMAGPMQIATGSVAERSVSAPASSNAVRWFGGDVHEKPDLYHLADAFERLSSATPPLLFMYGEHDHPENCQPSVDKLKAAGAVAAVRVYPEGKHGCWNQQPWFTDMSRDMVAFFREHL
ncbi:MAG: SMP-30/gluconolactonase/LRE family protein [Planctomycetaceae bacterium]|nr:SMP-30/gluconolactonase/LRE family protein [Planctomycetaceae bacterium]